MTSRTTPHRRLDPAERFGLRATLAGAALLLVAVPFSLLLLQVRQDGPLLRVDTRVAEALHSAVRDHGWLVVLLKAVTAIGTFVGLGSMVVIAAVLLLRAGRRRLLWFLVVTSVGGWLLNNGLKLLVGRARPVFDEPLATAHGLSFPSGHAMNSVSVLGALLVVFLPAARPGRRVWYVVGTSVLATAICFTRLALGVHYLTDVVAGAVLGVAWLLTCVALFSVWRTERGRASVDVLEGLEPEAAADLRDAASPGSATPGR